MSEFATAPSQPVFSAPRRQLTKGGQEGRGEHTSLLWRLFPSRSGVVFIGGLHRPRLGPLADYIVVAGLVGIVFHPSFASLAGARWSAVWVAVCMLLLLPAMARILLVPFASVAAAAMLGVVITKSPTAAAFGLSAYALFYMISYRARLFYNAYLALAGVAVVVATLQFLFRWEILNFHATAESLGNFLDQYRPTSIFPSQAYYNQLLLALVPLFFLIGERRAWVLFIAGAAGAMSGSTAGIVVAVSATLLVRSRGQFALLGFASLYLVMAVFYAPRLAYNFSIDDLVLSVGSRIIATGHVVSTDGFVSTSTADIPLTAMQGYPTLAIAIQVLAIMAVIFIPMIVARTRMRLLELLAYGMGFSAIIAGQMIHSVIGSLYFSIFCAILVAMAWRLFRQIAPS